MKKFLFTFSLMFLLLTSTAFGAAGTFIVTGDDLIRNSSMTNQAMRVITLTFVAGTGGDAGLIPDLALSANTSGLVHGSPLGWYGYAVIIDCNHAGTEPTEDSDLYILDTGGGDMLGGQGVDQIDNSTERQVYFHNGTIPFQQPMAVTWTVRILNNLVASATGTLKLIFIPGR